MALTAFGDYLQNRLLYTHQASSRSHYFYSQGISQDNMYFCTNVKLALLEGWNEKSLLAKQAFLKWPMKSQFEISRYQLSTDEKKPAQWAGFLKVVGEEGFEPPTLWSQTRCATKLRYSPTNVLFRLNRNRKPYLLSKLGYRINGVANEIRTRDHRNHNPGLYQLSYSHH